MQVIQLNQVFPVYCKTIHMRFFGVVKEIVIDNMQEGDVSLEFKHEQPGEDISIPRANFLTSVF